MKTILIHSIQDEFSTVAWQRANYREMSHIYECMESSNIPFKTSQIIAPLRGGAETSKQHNETMKRWSGEVMKPWRNNETAKKTNDEKPMWSIVGWVRWSVVLCWSKVLITCAYCCRGELYQLFFVVIIGWPGVFSEHLMPPTDFKPCLELFMQIGWLHIQYKVG